MCCGEQPAAGWTCLYVRFGLRPGPAACQAFVVPTRTCHPEQRQWLGQLSIRGLEPAALTRISRVPLDILMVLLREPWTHPSLTLISLRPYQQHALFLAFSTLMRIAEHMRIRSHPSLGDANIPPP